MKKLFTVALVLGLSIGLFMGCQRSSESKPQAAAAKTNIKIGMVNPMTGIAATYGQSHLKGMQLLMADINAAGGIDGHQLEIVTYDDAGDPQQAAAGAQKFADDQSIVAMVGSCLSSSTLAMIPIIDKAKLPDLVVSSSAASLEGCSPSFFRMSVQDNKVGGEIGNTIADTLKAKTCVILYPNNDYGKGLEASIRKTLEDKDVKVLQSFSYLATDQDFQAMLTTVKNLKHDAIAFCGTYTDGGLIVKQARQIGITSPFVGGTGPNSPKFIEIGGEAVEGFIFLGSFVPTNPDPKTQDFVSKFKAKFGEEPDNFAALAYDQMKVLQDSITRAMKANNGVVTRDTLREALKSCNVEGVTGIVTFDSENEWTRPYLKIQVKNGQFVVYNPPAS